MTENPNLNRTVYATSWVAVPDMGDVLVFTYNFDAPGYEACGFESVITTPDGKQWGMGAEPGDTPEKLHALACDPDMIAATRACL